MWCFISLNPKKFDVMRLLLYWIVTIGVFSQNTPWGVKYNSITEKRGQKMDFFGKKIYLNIEPSSDSVIMHHYYCCTQTLRAKLACEFFVKMSKNEGWMGKHMYSEGWGVDYSNEIISTFIWFIVLSSGIFLNMNWFWENE